MNQGSEADFDWITPIETNQAGMHEGLQARVSKHLTSTFRKPVSNHTQIAFDQVQPLVERALSTGEAKSLIFDSCCGTALSTHLIATQNPESLVLGIDRSAVRLGKQYNRQLPENAHLLQADCADFWRLANSAGWKLTKHFILYPNPYPKSAHLKRRWHAHPVFPTLIELEGELELRTNWKIYADEFCEAFKLARKNCTGVELIVPQIPMTLFEKKYQQSGHPLYRCKITL